MFDDPGKRLSVSFIYVFFGALMGLRVFAGVTARGLWAPSVAGSSGERLFVPPFADSA